MASASLLECSARRIPLTLGRGCVTNHVAPLSVGDAFDALPFRNEYPPITLSYVQWLVKTNPTSASDDKINIARNMINIALCQFNVVEFEQSVLEHASEVHHRLIKRLARRVDDKADEFIVDAFNALLAAHLLLTDDDMLKSVSVRGDGFSRFIHINSLVPVVHLVFPDLVQNIHNIHNRHWDDDDYHEFASDLKYIDDVSTFEESFFQCNNL